MDDFSLNKKSVINIDIPRFERVVEQREKHYTVYKIVITKAGGILEVSKRYSEFHRLHNKLSKTNQLPRNIGFPAKLTLNSGSVSTKEDRRRKLKIFLQKLCDLNPIPQEVLDFLTISQPIQSFHSNLGSSSSNGNYSSNEDLLDSNVSYRHQPLLGFKQESINCKENVGLYDCTMIATQDDIVLSGILDEFYEDNSLVG